MCALLQIKESDKIWIVIAMKHSQLIFLKSIPGFVFSGQLKFMKPKLFECI